MRAPLQSLPSGPVPNIYESEHVLVNYGFSKRNKRTNTFLRIFPDGVKKDSNVHFTLVLGFNGNSFVGSNLRVVVSGTPWATVYPVL
jgi:hypothetical protein